MLLQTFRKNVERVCAGNGFSIFLSNKGLLMSCGDYESGCLGNFTKQNCLVPKLIDDLISLHISDVSCGEEHVIAISATGDVFAWGLNNSDGRLGIEVQSAQPVLTPTQVSFPSGIRIVRVFCGNDCSVFLDEVGNVWACGSNKLNKLGLNEVTMTRVKKVERSLYPEKLKLKETVTSVGVGPKNITLLLKSGNVLVLGSNEDAQMSCGHIGYVGKMFP